MAKRKVVFPENMGRTLAYEKRQAKKYDVNIDDDTLIVDGSIKVNPELVSKINEPRKEQTGVSVNGNGELVQQFSDGTSQKVNLANALRNKVRVATTQPITGDGTTTNPIGLNYSTNDFKVVNGQLQLVQEPMELITDFGTHTYKQGLHAFYGASNRTTFGLPLDISSEDYQQDMATEPVQEYDYNGYYIADNGQVTIWLSGVTGTSWYIMNDHGINNDGSLKRPAQSDWGKWQKLDNPRIAEEAFKALQAQANKNSNDIATLGTKLNTAESEIDKLKDSTGNERITNFLTHPYKTGIHPFTVGSDVVGYPKYNEAGVEGNITVTGAGSNTSGRDMTGFYVNSQGGEVMVILNDGVTGGTWLYIDDNPSTTNTKTPEQMTWHNIRGTATQNKFKEVDESIAAIQKVADALKGLGQWNDKTGELQLLSKTSNNLLQQYPDGLYYGITAPANVSNLYVDAINGVDQDPNVVKGAGSRNKPLRTIEYAISLKPDNTNSRIYLKESQTHDWDEQLVGAQLNLKRNVELIFYPYGDVTSNLLNNQTEGGNWIFRSWYPEKPIINFKHQRYYTNASTFLLNNEFNWCKSLNFWSMQFTDEYTYTEARAKFGSDVVDNYLQQRPHYPNLFGQRDLDHTLNFYGCVFLPTLKSHVSYSQKQISVRLDRCAFLQQRSFFALNENTYYSLALIQRANTATPTKWWDDSDAMVKDKSGPKPLGYLITPPVSEWESKIAPRKYITGTLLEW